MKRSILIVLSLLFISAGEFKTAQLKYARVKDAYKTKESVLKEEIKTTGLEFGKHSLLIRVFKKEEILEVWLGNNTKVYKLFKTYKVCAASGSLGPKRKMGDNQVPEGYYHIDRFNPQSNFHLSLGLNYPNASDKLLSDAKTPGGDIFIHGYCASIGCMAMTDEKIKEIYILAVEAKNSGQSKIPVHIYPFKMTEENMALVKENNKNDIGLILFWENIKKGFDSFEKNKKIPLISVDSKGNYLFK